MDFELTRSMLFFQKAFSYSDFNSVLSKANIIAVVEVTLATG